MPNSAVIIGGGPAGLSAALGLINAGWTATVFEQRVKWSGRVCGSFLNDEAARHLRSLGVFDAAMRRGALRVERARLTGFGRALEIDLTRDGETALAFPREDLEALLVEEILARGGFVREGHRVNAVLREGAGARVFYRSASKATSSARADLVVAAAGRFWNAPPDPGAGGWFGWNASFSDSSQPPGLLSLHFYPLGYVGVLRFSSGMTNVCGLAHRAAGEKLDWESVLNRARTFCPELDLSLSGARRSSEFQGVGPLPFSMRLRPCPDGVPVGDAAAVGDPFAGEGIGRALAAGPLLRALAAQGALGRDAAGAYQAAWSGAYGARLSVGRWTRWAMLRPRLFSAAFRQLASRPWLAERMRPSFHRGFPSPAGTP